MGKSENHRQIESSCSALKQLGKSSRILKKYKACHSKLKDDHRKTEGRKLICDIRLASQNKKLIIQQYPDQCELVASPSQAANDTCDSAQLEYVKNESHSDSWSGVILSLKKDITMENLKKETANKYLLLCCEKKEHELKCVLREKEQQPETDGTEVFIIHKESEERFSLEHSMFKKWYLHVEDKKVKMLQDPERSQRTCFKFIEKK